jgi:hypothetical protein
MFDLGRTDLAPRLRPFQHQRTQLAPSYQGLREQPGEEESGKARHYCSRSVGALEGLLCGAEARSQRGPPVVAATWMRRSEGRRVYPGSGAIGAR